MESFGDKPRNEPATFRIIAGSATVHLDEELTDNGSEAVHPSGAISSIKAKPLVIGVGTQYRVSVWDEPSGPPRHAAETRLIGGTSEVTVTVGDCMSERVPCKSANCGVTKCGLAHRFLCLLEALCDLLPPADGPVQLLAPWSADKHLLQLCLRVGSLGHVTLPPLGPEHAPELNKVHSGFPWQFVV